MDVEGVLCPICGAQTRLYMNVYVHPNDMFQIMSCRHINISCCYDEEEAIGELTEVISELNGE